MIQALVVSNILLWLLVVVLGITVLALARQVGLLHERVAPAGALAARRGPEVGEAAPHLMLQTLDGTPLQLGGVAGDGRATLLFFLSPSCPVCKTLLPTLERVAADESLPTRVLIASDGLSSEHRAFAREQGLDLGSYVLSTELGLAYQVAKLPYAVLVDGRGTLRAKGIVNTREHVESLFEAAELGVGSVQEFLASRDPSAASSGAARRVAS